MKKLLIVGAGGHGKVVAEIARDCGYEKISFLDDKSLEAIGRVNEIDRFSREFENAFVGIGNNKFRGELIKRLETSGYHIPILVHPSAYVSRTAVIGKGTVVEPKAIVNANSEIGIGCIISVGAIVDHDVEIGENCHVNAGAIVRAGVTVEPYTKLEAEQVILEYR